MSFRFQLKQRVTIIETGEQGIIIGRAEYSNTPLNKYLLRYHRADGCAVKLWWSEDALKIA